MQHPLRAAEHGLQAPAQLRAVALRGEEEGARPRAAHLEQEHAIVVAVGGGALGVDSKGAPSPGQGLGRAGEVLGRGREIGRALARGEQRGGGHGVRVRASGVTPSGGRPATLAST